jgi:peptide/nickel transport system substrate-binding protein
MKRRAQVVLVAGMAVLLPLVAAAALHPGAGAAATPSSTITVALPSTVPPFDPQKYDLQYLRAVTDNIYEPLLGRNANGRLAPILAREMPTRVNPTTWRFKLRRGIKFTNGEPMDARAAGYSIGRVANPAFNSDWLSLIDTIRTVRAVDRYTLLVITKDADALLPARMPIIKIIPPKYSRTSNYLRHPIGTGPYLHVSGSGNGPITLRRNRAYWGRKTATIERIRIRTIPDVSTRVSALRAGEVNLITVLPPDAARTVPKVVTAVGVENPTIILNTGVGITADVRVRRALNLAIDKNAIAKSLFGGYATPSKCQPLSPSSFGYNGDLKPYAYSPSQARSLLQAAGAQGKTIKLVSSEVFNKGPELARVIAAFWTAVGLKVDLEIPPFQTYLDALFAKGAKHPDSVYVSTSSDLLDASSAARQLASDGIQSAYANSTVDSLFKQATEETDTAKREQLYHRLLSIACSNAALVNLIHPQDLYGTSRNLRWTARFDGGLLYSTMSLSG